MNGKSGLIALTADFNGISEGRLKYDDPPPKKIKNNSATAQTPAYAHNGINAIIQVDSIQILTAGKALVKTPSGKLTEVNQCPNDIDENPADIAEYQPLVTDKAAVGTLLNVVDDHNKDATKGNPTELDDKLGLKSAEDKAAAPEKDANAKEELGTEQLLSELEALIPKVALHPKLVKNSVKQVGNESDNGTEINALLKDDDPKPLADIVHGKPLDIKATVEGISSSEPLTLSSRLEGNRTMGALLDNIEALANSASERLKRGDIDKIAELDDQPKEVIALLIGLIDKLTRLNNTPPYAVAEKIKDRALLIRLPELNNQNGIEVRLVEVTSDKFKLLLGNRTVPNIDSDTEVDDAAVAEVDDNVVTMEPRTEAGIELPVNNEVKTTKLIPIVDIYTLVLNEAELFKREDKPNREGAIEEPLNGNKPNNSEVREVLIVVDGSIDRLAEELANDVPDKLGKKDKQIKEALNCPDAKLGVSTLNNGPIKLLKLLKFDKLDSAIEDSGNGNNDKEAKPSLKIVDNKVAL